MQSVFDCISVPLGSILTFRNAFRPETVNEIIEALNLVQNDETVGVLVITGAGDKAFCSGGDQKVRGDAGYIGKDGVPRLNILKFKKKSAHFPSQS